jgi:glyoxylase-like metal-dependent hydrolase (beta-lactamase superfamily II)
VVSLLQHVTVVNLDARLRVLLGGGGNTVVFTHGKDAFVSDVKVGDYALRVRREVELELGRKVQRLLITHAHFDHAGGLFAFPDVPVVLVHPNSRARLERKGVKAHFVEVEEEVELTLAGEKLRILNLGSGHTDGDLVAHFPGRKLLIAGDLFNCALGPNVAEGDGGDIAALADTLQRLAALEDVERVVPGHGEVCDRALLLRDAAYLKALKEQVLRARAEGLDLNATVQRVRLDEFAEVGDFFGLDSREKNVRRMYKSLGDHDEDRAVDSFR